MAVINKVSLPSGDSFDVSTLSIPFGQVDDTSTATVFTATIPGITALYDGVCVYLKNGVVTSASGWTLNINDLGAKPVYQSMAAASRTTTIFNVAYTGLFVYNSSRIEGGCWDYFYGYNSNDNTLAYQIRGNQTVLKMHAALTRYKICFSRFDGTLLPSTTVSNSTATTKELTTESFDPHGFIYYYNTTTGVAAGESPDASYMWFYYPTVDLRYGFNTGTTLVAKEPVYIQCSPQDDGSFKLSGNDCIVQELPSTDDGYAYIYLGKAFDTYMMSLDLHHPIYCYKNGAIVQWGSVFGSTPDWNENDSTSDAYIANRTHYRTSLGNNIPITITINSIDHLEDYFVHNNKSWHYMAKESGTTISDYNSSELLDFEDVTQLSATVSINGSSSIHTLAVSGNTTIDSDSQGFIEFEDNDILMAIGWSYYNSEFSYEIYTQIYFENIVSSPTFYDDVTDEVIITFNLPVANEQFQYTKLDNNYLNGKLIRFGEQEESEIFNNYYTETHGNNIIPNKKDFGDNAHIEGYAEPEVCSITLSGPANSFEYAVSNVSIYPDYKFCSAFGCELFTTNEEPTGIYISAIPGGPDLIGLTDTLDANNAVSNAEYIVYLPGSVAGQAAHAEGRNTYAGACSHAEGRNTYAGGSCSHAEGQETLASGSSSHAEGNSTTASASNAHAEGNGTTASSNSSHAEGSNTTASGYYAHAEGDSTTASASNAHAEGNSTTASSNSSHAEGSGTTASGNYSHAEGNGTTAQRRSQHVFGEYNVLDTTGSNATNKGSYIEIVGKGTSNTNRSNARTLDWSGNEVLAGKLTVGTGPTNNMDVATKQYVDNATASITDEKLSTGTIGSGVYYPIVGTNTASATTKYIDSTGFKYDATSSTNGYARLYLGNGTASGTEGSKYGRLMIYGTTAYAVTLDSGSPTENRDISLPNKNGTIALTSDIPTEVSDLTDTTITSPTNGQVLMYNSTTSKWENTSLPIYNGGVSS